MSIPAKRILITNTVALNGGDAAILHAMMFLLRGAFGNETEFIVYDSSPAVAAKYYPDIQFRQLLFWRAVPKTRIGIIRSAAKRWNLSRMRLALLCWKHCRPVASILLTKEERIDFENYSSADYIISTGGTYLVDHYSLAARVFDYRLSLRMGRPLVFFTQSLGPFARLSAGTRRALKGIFERARLILLRDERSLQHLKDLEVRDANCHVAADAVFALADTAVLEAAARPSPVKAAEMTVAISVREWRRFAHGSKERGMAEYEQAMRALTTHLVEQHRAKVVFISTCQGIPEYQFDDSRVAADIVSGLPPAVCARTEVDTAFHSPTELASRLRQFDVTVGTRMHFCILSLMAGVPVLPIAYEFKTNELFSRLGLAEWVQNIETVQPGALIKAFDGFWQALPAIRPQLFSNVERERQSALQSVSLIRQ